MKLGFKYFCVVIFTLIIVTPKILAQVKNLGAVSSTGCIVVTWTSESESNVNYYKLYRRNLNSEKFDCVCDNIKCLGSYQTYTIQDNNGLFMTTGVMFQYKVTVVLKDGSTVDSNIVPAYYDNNASSAAKRTWGSIKAMFR